jgi:hypothetical protein
MPRISSSEITLVDVTDGTNPISAFLTNENHSFSQTEAGVVNNVAGFSTRLIVYEGATPLVYDTDNSLANGEYRITSAAYVETATNWGLPIGINHSNATITIPSIGAITEKQVTLRITFSYRNSLGTTVTGLTKDCTLSVIQQGAGGLVIDLTPANQIFTADSAGVLTASQPDIVVAVNTQGSVGSYIYSTSLNGGTFVVKTTTADTPGNISGFDSDDTGSKLTGALPASGLARLFISQNNLGDANNTLTVKLAGATGGVDFVTIYKARQGVTGVAAIVVVIESNSGTIFKNNLGTAKTLTCKVFDMSTGAQITTGVTYTWTRSSGTLFVDNLTNRNVQAAGGVALTAGAYPTIVVGPEDVDTSEKFACSVSVD